jgi:hypothetical protein
MNQKKTGPTANVGIISENIFWVKKPKMEGKVRLPPSQKLSPFGGEEVLEMDRPDQFPRLSVPDQIHQFPTLSESQRISFQNCTDIQAMVGAFIQANQGYLCI